MTKRTLIIAEAGVNHNGDMEKAIKLINVAAESGADLIKFQTFSADRLVTKVAPKADYQIRTDAILESQHEMLRSLELTDSMHKELMAHCVARGIGFFSTAYDIESVNLLFGMGQDIFKIPSGEITNLPYLRHIGRIGKPIIMSTGMAEIEEIRLAITELVEAGTPREIITVLHCTSEYPAPMREVNLRAMLTIKKNFSVDIGYSDHTPGIEVAIAAVALGASVIEKHFTLDRNLPGPDHKASLEPKELLSMVRAIRNIEIALGDGINRITPGEARNRSVVRKSLVASRAIKKGELFTVDNIVAKRPGTGISPMRWDEVIGRSAQRDFSQDELIEL